MTRGGEVAGQIDEVDLREQSEDVADLRAYRSALADDDGQRVPLDALRAED